MSTTGKDPSLNSSQGDQSGGLKNKIIEIFGLDVRSLALFRIGLALLMLWDIYSRMLDLRAHYTDEGVLPRYLLNQEIPVSIHIFLGSGWFQLVLSGIAAVFALMLLVGWKTKLATVVCWFFLLSLQARNMMVYHNGDTMLRLIFFWGIFLPLGACWSVDARRSPRPPRASPLIISAGTLAYIAQVVMVYWFAVASKTGPEWQEFKTAVYYALEGDPIVSPLGKMVAPYHGLAKFLTYVTLWVESALPALLLFPIATQPLRILAVFLGISLHAGFALFLVLGNFGPVAFVMWSAVLPPLFWNKLGARFGSSRWGRVTLDRSPDPSAPRWEQIAYEGARSSSLAFVILFCSLYSLAYNVRGIATSFPEPIKEYVATGFPIQDNNLGWAIGLEQGWGVFAPSPGKLNGWYVVLGTLKNGETVDLYNRGKFVDHEWVMIPAEKREEYLLERPADIGATYINSRWRRYLQNLPEAMHAQHRPNFADYLWREWERVHPDRQLKEVTLYWIQEWTLPPGQGKTPATPWLMGTLYRVSSDAPADPNEKAQR